MKEQSDKTRLILIGILSVSVVLGFGAYGFTVLKQGQIPAASTAIIVGVIMLLGTIFILRNKYSDIKKGLPLEDERSRKVMLVAAAKAFLLSIWMLLIISWISDTRFIAFRDVSQALNYSIAGMAVLFGLCWLYYNRKEDIDQVRF